MHKVWLTAKREYVERIRSRAFRIIKELLKSSYLGRFNRLIQNKGSFNHTEKGDAERGGWG